MAQASGRTQSLVIIITLLRILLSEFIENSLAAHGTLFHKFEPVRIKTGSDIKGVHVSVWYLTCYFHN
jgi:hypothetical protein